MRVFAQVHTLQVGLHHKRLPFEVCFLAAAMYKTIFQRKVVNRCCLDELLCNTLVLLQSVIEELTAVIIANEVLSRVHRVDSRLDLLGHGIWGVP